MLGKVGRGPFGLARRLRWRTFEGLPAWCHDCLDVDDRASCLYRAKRERGRDRPERKHSYAYRVVSDYKIPVEKCRDDRRAARRKRRACEVVTRDLCALFADVPSCRFGLVPAPTSKSRDDPRYDDRIDRVCLEVSRRCENVTCFDLLSSSRSRKAAKSGGDRSVDGVARLTRVNSNADLGGLDYLVVFDDVVTSGAHFKACQKLLYKAYGVHACGVFWARTVNEGGRGKVEGPRGTDVWPKRIGLVGRKAFGLGRRFFRLVLKFMRHA